MLRRRWLVQSLVIRNLNYRGSIFSHTQCRPKWKPWQDVCVCATCSLLSNLCWKKYMCEASCMRATYSNSLSCSWIECTWFHVSNRNFQTIACTFQAFPEIDSMWSTMNSAEYVPLGSKNPSLAPSWRNAVSIGFVRHGSCRTLEMEVTCSFDFTRGDVGPVSIAGCSTACLQRFCWSFCWWCCSDAGMLEQGIGWIFPWYPLYEFNGSDFQPRIPATCLHLFVESVKNNWSIFPLNWKT